MKRIVLGLVVLGFSCCAASFHDEHEKGWFWYEDQEQKKEKTYESEENQKELHSATAELKEFQKKFEEVKAKAIMDPTTENVQEYQKMEREIREKAAKFAEVYDKVSQQNSKS